MGGESTLGRDDQIGWIPEKQVGDVQKNFFFMCTALAIVGLFIHVGEVKHWYLEKKPLNRRGDLLERKHRIKKRVVPVLYNFWRFFFFFIPWSLKLYYSQDPKSGCIQFCTFFLPKLCCSVNHYVYTCLWDISVST